MPEHATGALNLYSAVVAMRCWFPQPNVELSCVLRRAALAWWHRMREAHCHHRRIQIQRTRRVLWHRDLGSRLPKRVSVLSLHGRYFSNPARPAWPPSNPPRPRTPKSGQRSLAARCWHAFHELEVALAVRVWLPTSRAWPTATSIPFAPKPQRARCPVPGALSWLARSGKVMSATGSRTRCCSPAVRWQWAVTSTKAPATLRLSRRYVQQPYALSGCSRRRRHVYCRNAT